MGSKDAAVEGAAFVLQVLVCRRPHFSALLVILAAMVVDAKYPLEAHSPGAPWVRGHREMSSVNRWRRERARYCRAGVHRAPLWRNARQCRRPVCPVLDEMAPRAAIGQ